MTEKRYSRSNQVLKIPEELARIQKLRDRLVGTDRNDHLQLLDEWERKVKKAAILLSLQNHEGIQILIDKCDEELAAIDQVLREGSKPKELSPEAAMQYTMEQWALHEKKEHWTWFRSLFTDAKRDIAEVRMDLDVEDRLAEETDEY